MTKRFFPLLLALLLCGCTAQTPFPASAGMQEIPVSPELVQLHAQEDLTVYALPEGQILGLFPLEDSFLLLRQENEESILTVYSGSIPVASRTLSFPVKPVLHCDGKRVSCFDPNARQIILLSDTMEEITRIDVPSDLMGTPLLSRDCKKLYYCTPAALRVLDLESGINRLIKEISHPFQTMSEALLSDSVLALRIMDQDSSGILYLCENTGKLLCRRNDSPMIHSTGSQYAALVPTYNSTILFGEKDQPPKILLPRYMDGAPVILSERQVLTAFHTDEGSTILDLYDLTSGKRTASTAITGIFSPDGGCCAGSGTIALYGAGPEGQILLQWDASGSALVDDHPYWDILHNPEEPDTHRISECYLYAAQIQQRYGIDILIHQEAVTAALSAGISAEHEYLTGILQRDLERLDRWLGNFPDGFLQTLRGSLSSLRICLVRQIGEAGPDGVGLRNGQDACIVLTSGQDAEEILYRELFRLAETTVLNHSTACDQWELLNPSGFSYCTSYGTDDRMNGQEWLQAGKESFLNTASMHSPQEDRIRIMAHAMFPGNGDTFQSPYLQAKLSRLCTGFREAFGLKETPLWEQYLHTPFSP